MKKMKILVVMLLISKISLGTNNSCLQKYETKPSISQSMSQRLAIYIQNSRNSNGGYDFFPISFTLFLKAEYSQIINRFERQIELLQAKGDKNPLTSNLSIYSAAEKTMDSKLQDIEKNIDPNLVQRILKWKKSRESKLQQLVKEANDCKGRLNACAFNLNQAITETIRNLTVLTNLVSTLESYKGEYSLLVRALESDPRGFGIEQNAFNSALPLLNAHDVEVSNMISTLKNIVSLNEEKLIMAKLKDTNLDETNQRIKELQAEGVENLNVYGISSNAYYNGPSPSKISTITKMSNKINSLIENFARGGGVSKATAGVLLFSASVLSLGGAGYGTYGLVQTSQLEMKMEMEKPTVLAAIRQAKRSNSSERRDEMKWQIYFKNFSNMSMDEVNYLVKNMDIKKNADDILTHYLNYIKNKPTAEYEQKSKSQMEKKYPDFMNSLYIAEQIADYRERSETLNRLFENNYTKFSFDEVKYLASKAYHGNWSDRVFRMYSTYKDSHK